MAYSNPREGISAKNRRRKPGLATVSFSVGSKALIEKRLLGDENVTDCSER